MERLALARRCHEGSGVLRAPVGSRPRSGAREVHRSAGTPFDSGAPAPVGVPVTPEGGLPVSGKLSNKRMLENLNMGPIEIAEINIIRNSQDARNDRHKKR